MNIKFSDMIGLAILVGAAALYVSKEGVDPIGFLKSFKGAATPAPGSGKVETLYFKTGQESQLSSFAPTIAKSLALQVKETTSDAKSKLLGITVMNQGITPIGRKELAIYWFLPSGQVLSERLTAALETDLIYVPFPVGAPMNQTDWIVAVSTQGKLLKTCASSEQHLLMAGSELGLRKLEQTAIRK